MIMPPMTKTLLLAPALLMGIACNDPNGLPPPVAKVTVSPSAANVLIGGTMQLVAQTEDVTGNVLTERVVTWASSNTAVATVSSTGLMMGVGAGQATITATSEGQRGTAAITVNTALTITPASDSVQAGAGLALFRATVRDAAGNVISDRPITWSSSDTTIAQIEASYPGWVYVLGIRAGQATITATSEGATAAAALKVLVAAASVTIAPSETTVVAGSTFLLSATLRDSAGNILDRSLLWGCGCNDVVQLDPTGPHTARVTALIAGGGTVYANQDGIPPVGSAHITVKGTGDVGSVALTPLVTVVFVGGTAQLTATLRDTAGSILTGTPITWAVKRPDLLSVRQTGLVTGVAPVGFTDDTRVTATSEGVRGVADVNVAPADAIVTITPGSATLPIGATVQLTAEVTTGRLTFPGGEYTWSSSDTLVASVSATGLVTARSIGPPVITATMQGRSSSVSITVVSQ